MPATYESDAAVTGPTWLRGPVAVRIRAAIGVALDHGFDGLKQAVLARFVQRAPADALSDLGDERHIEQYPGDTTATYRARVLLAWDLWQQGGTAAGIIAALKSIGFTSVRIYTANGSGMPGEGVWPPDGDTSNWSRFWVLIDVSGSEVNPFAWVRVLWGDRPFGTDWTWGSTATPGQVALVRRVVRLWKAAHEICGGIFVDLPDGTRLRWAGME
jgi:hypothetical protein